MIDKNSPIPIYYQLEEEIRNLIESEQLVPGDQLPSEREFAEEHDISRMTVRQAINNMVTEGLIYRQKGKGSFIAEKKFEQDLSGLTGFSEDMLNRGLTPSNKNISLEIIFGNRKVASILKIEPTEPIYEIRRIRLANNEPVALETAYTPQKIVGDLLAKKTTDSFYDFVEETLHLKISHGEQIIESTLATEEEINHLQIKKGDPILLMQRTSYLQNEQETPIEYVKSAYRADKYSFRMRMKRQ